MVKYETVTPPVDARIPAPTRLTRDGVVAVRATTRWADARAEIPRIVVLLFAVVRDAIDRDAALLRTAVFTSVDSPFELRILTLRVETLRDGAVVRDAVFAVVRDAVFVVARVVVVRASVRVFATVRPGAVRGVFARAGLFCAGAIGSAKTARIDNNVEQIKNAPANRNTVPIAFLYAFVIFWFFIELS